MNMPIENEQQFKKVITALEEKNGSKGHFQSSKFDELAKYVHESLEKQDSDQALTLITKGALSLGSSDVHYDMSEENTQVRLRIDGNLVTIFTLSFQQYKLLLERLKYKSELKLNITTVPQDGKYRISDAGSRIDVRVSTLPVKTGENVVCRILDSTNAIPKASDLGFIWTSKRQIDKSLKKKSGMILVT